MLQVFVARHPMEAHIVLGLLDGAGIDAEVRGEALYSVMETGPAVPGVLPTVWISREEQGPEALALVARFAEGSLLPGAGASAWVCEKCGEAHESQFTECWKCGENRP